MFRDIEELNSKIAEFENNMNSTNGYIDLFKQNLFLLKSTSAHLNEVGETLGAKTNDVVATMKEVSDSIQDSNSEVVGALAKNSSEISDALKNEIAQFEHNVNSTNGCINLLKQNLSLLEALSLHMHEARGTFDTNATSIISRVRQVTDTILNSNSELVDAFGKNSTQISNCISKNNSETLHSIGNIFNRQEILINFLTKNFADLFDIITSNKTETTNILNTLKDKVTNIEKNIKFVKALGLAQVLILIFFFIASLIF